MPLPTRRVAALAAMLAATTPILPLPALASGGSATSTAAVTETNRHVVSEAFARWASGGNSFFNDVLSDDVIWTIEGSGPSAGVFRGRTDFIEHAVKPFVTRLSTPVRPTDYRVWADGDHVIINWEGSGVARDGRPYTNRYAWIFRMQDSKAVEVAAFLDLPVYDDVLRRIPATTQ